MLFALPMMIYALNLLYQIKNALTRRGLPNEAQTTEE